MKIHHIGMLSANIEKEARHLCESCGYERVSDEIVDEIQTAKVLFLKLPAENSLLELISPHGENSKLDGAMKKGIKFHHICFQSDDMESDLKKFRNNGTFEKTERRRPEGP